MKKILAIAVVLMMLCGFAFAEEEYFSVTDTVINVLSEYLETEVETESTYDTETLTNNALVAFVVPSGYLLTYQDNNGECYYWENYENSYEDSARLMIIALGTFYDLGLIEVGYFYAENGSVVISCYDLPSLGIYNNVEEFQIACVSVL